MSVCDIPCGHKQELVRQAMQRKRIDEIRILGNNNCLLPDRNIVDLGITRPISHGEIERMHRLVSQPLQPLRQTVWEVRINKKLHMVTGWMRFT